MTTAIPQRYLGGDAKHVAVGAIGFGAMGLTWIDPALMPSEEDAMKAIKAAFDAGATFINSAQIYGPPDDPEANLKLLRRFYDKYPQYVDKTVISVKGGMGPNGLAGGPDSSLENLRRDLLSIKSALGDKKVIDLYGPARVDPKMRIEDIMENLLTLKKEGHFKYIFLSEIAASAVRRAHAVGPIAAVEIEMSMFMGDREAVDVLDTCKELDIALVAYSPLGRGLIAGRFKSEADIPEGDMRKNFPQFQGENFKNNMKLVEQVDAMAQKKGVAPAQLALAYIMNLYDKLIPIPGSTSVKRTLENVEAANVKFAPGEFEEIHKSIQQFSVAGDRYPGNGYGLNWGTGQD